MKDIPKLDYTSPPEAIAEKFHMSEQLLAAFNAGKRFDPCGRTIVVVDTDVGESGETAKTDRVEVDKTDPKALRQVECADRFLSGDHRERREAVAVGHAEGMIIFFMVSSSGASK